MAESIRQSNLKIQNRADGESNPDASPADPLEVGELAAFLASDESSLFNRTQNVIDGGNTLPETVRSASDSLGFLPPFVGRICLFLSTSKSPNGKNNRYLFHVRYKYDGY